MSSRWHLRIGSCLCMAAFAISLLGCGGGDPESGLAAGSGDGAFMSTLRLTSPDVPTMAADSDVIAVGTVTGPPTYFVNPGDPTDEPLPEDIHPEQAREVLTFVPDQMLKGDARPAFFIVQDDLRLISETDQRPAGPGDEVVIFLKSSPQDAPGAPADAYNVMGVDQGVFDVTEDGIAPRTPELFVDGAVLPGTLEELQAMVSPEGDEG